MKYSSEFNKMTKKQINQVFAGQKPTFFKGKLMVFLPIVGVTEKSHADKIQFRSIPQKICRISGHSTSL